MPNRDLRRPTRPFRSAIIALRRPDDQFIKHYLTLLAHFMGHGIPLLGFFLRGRRFPLTPHDARVEIMLLGQSAIAVTCLSICSMLGASLFFVAPAAATFCILLCGFNCLALSTVPNGLGPHYRNIGWFVSAGAIVTGLILMLIALALWPRAAELHLACAILIFIGLSLPAVTIFPARDASIPWVHFAVGVTTLPILLAWGFASAAAAMLKPSLLPTADWISRPSTPDSVFERRAQWAASPGWRTSDNRPLTVSVFLSGGGYRAASIHAGLLRALDDNCVPIRYLTTVSGGSIFGAYYALGYTPDQFITLLRARKPGLPDDVLSIRYLPLNLWIPGWSNVDTYSRHLNSIYFHDSTLGDTRLTPELIINATDIENTGLTNSREVFFKARSSQYPDLDKTLLSDVVAASAAFPGAFQPKTITWPPDVGNGKPAKRRFVDGGVVENLGYTGWERFLKIRAVGTPPEQVLNPDYVIISDASAEVSGGTLPDKVDFMDLLSRSEDISFSTQHVLLKRHIMERERRFVFVRAQDEIKALSQECYAKEGFQCLVPGDEAARHVGALSTLKELEARDVHMASWVGYELGRRHWAELDRWRAEVTGQKDSCASQ